MFYNSYQLDLHTEAYVAMSNDLLEWSINKSRIKNWASPLVSFRLVMVIGGTCLLIHIFICNWVGIFPIVFVVECGIVNTKSRGSPTSFAHVSLSRLLFDPHRTTHQSNYWGPIKKHNIAYIKANGFETSIFPLCAQFSRLTWNMWLVQNDFQNPNHPRSHFLHPILFIAKVNSLQVVKWPCSPLPPPPN